MRSPDVVEAQALADQTARFADQAVGVQVGFLVFHRTPQTLVYDIVVPGAAAVRADGDFLAA